MINLKSNTLKGYYGETPDDYSLKFIHYDFFIEEENPVELQNLENDLKNIFDYTQDFQIYFQNISHFLKIINTTHILQNYYANIFLRINDLEEYYQFKKAKITFPIHLIVSKNSLLKFDITAENITLQIDKISELTEKDLEELRQKYKITQILLGQINYLSKENKYLYDVMAKMYHIDSHNYEELEKMNKITNDVYDSDTYIKIVQKIKEIIKSLCIKNEIDAIRKVYEYIAQTVSYASLLPNQTNIENQNLIGPLFKQESVCEGYAKLFYQTMSLLKINTTIVGGGEKKEEGGHVWNQIFINNTWYNLDVTAHSYNLKHNIQNNTFLVADDCLYYKAHTLLTHECTTSFSEDNNPKKLS